MNSLFHFSLSCMFVCYVLTVLWVIHNLGAQIDTHGFPCLLSWPKCVTCMVPLFCEDKGVLTVTCVWATGGTLEPLPQSFAWVLLWQPASSVALASMWVGRWGPWTPMFLWLVFYVFISGHKYCSLGHKHWIQLGLSSMHTYALCCSCRNASGYR